MVSPELSQVLHGAVRRSLMRQRMDEARARFREATLYAFNGGIFEISPAFMMEVEYVTDKLWNPPGPLIVMDRDGYPVEIMEPYDFFDVILRKWRSAATRFNMDVKLARETHIPDLLDGCAE